jgi:hypothetical protein
MDSAALQSSGGHGTMTPPTRMAVGLPNNAYLWTPPVKR